MGSIVSLPVPIAANLINSFLPILRYIYQNKILLTLLRQHSVSIIYSRILSEKKIWKYLMIESSAQIRTSYNTKIYGLNMTVKHDSKTSAEKYVSSQIGHKLFVEISTPLPKSMHESY